MKHPNAPVVEKEKDSQKAQSGFQQEHQRNKSLEP